MTCSSKLMSYKMLYIGTVITKLDSGLSCYTSQWREDVLTCLKKSIPEAVAGCLIYALLIAEKLHCLTFSQHLY